MEKTVPVDNNVVARLSFSGTVSPGFLLLYQNKIPWLFPDFPFIFPWPNDKRFTSLYEQQYSMHYCTNYTLQKSEQIKINVDHFWQQA